jgi:predicted ferric reductase
VKLRNILGDRFPNLKVWQLSWILTVVSLMITTVLWAAARFPGEVPPDYLPWRALSQLTMLWSATLMAIAMLAVVRAHAFEPVFGGLDRAVHFHRAVGPAAIVLMIAHVIFLALAALQTGTCVGEVFIPF